MGGNGKALARRPGDTDFDLATTAAVVDSLVLRGDISALTAEQRTAYYVQTCESLGLNPASQPFAMLRLNGKEILYPTRGATDQLAAIHRITREIIDGPRLIDLNGTKLVYALCRATHPNGRSETASATVPFSDPVNVLMKAETKSKRRATLSILGLGMLDETELETIPASVKSAARPIGPVVASEAVTERGEPAVLGRIRDDLVQLGPPVSAEQAGAVYADHAAHIDADVMAEGFEICLRACVEGTSKAALRRAIDAASAPAQARTTGPEAPVQTVEATPLRPLPPALTAFTQAVAEIELPGEAVGLWIKHRKELSELARDDREGAWKLLCKRTEEVGGMKNAKAWLKKAIAVEDARRGKGENEQYPNSGSEPGAAESTQPAPSDDDPKPPRGGKRPAANDAPASAEGTAAPVASSAAPAARAVTISTVGTRISTRDWEQRIMTYSTPQHIANSVAAHYHEFADPIACVNAAARRLRAFKSVDDPHALIQAARRVRDAHEAA